MNLTDSETSYLRSLGLFIREKCDGCRKALNQTCRYTITGKPEVYCSALCRDTVLFGCVETAKRHNTPGRCAFCGATLKGKRRGAIYCGEACRKRDSRSGHRNRTGKPAITRTAA